MPSAHLIRPFTSRQLSLVSGDGRVMVLAVVGGWYAADTLLVHHPTLLQRLDNLPRQIQTVVFIDEPVPDGAAIGLIDDMVDTFSGLDVDVLAQYVPVNEAVKRVTEGRIREGVDRSSLFAVRAPEVIRRSILDVAARGAADRDWINPTALVAQSGGTIRLAIGGVLLDASPDREKRFAP